MQLPLLVPHSNWRPPRIADLPSWNDCKRVAIDIETCDPELENLGPGVRRGAYIAGYSFALEDGPKFYIPLRHYGGDNVEDTQQALGYLHEQAENFAGEIVGANLGYDLDFLWAQNIKFPQIKMYRDIQVAEALIDELQFSYSLETISNKYLGIGKSEGILREAAVAYGVDPKKGLHLLPARFVGEYAIADAALPLLNLRRQERIIDEQELWPIYDMESRLLPVLVKMRQLGVRINLAHLEKVEQWSMTEERKALAEIKHHSGVTVPFNSVWQASALASALGALSINIPLTPKTRKPSIDKAFLNSIDHPIAQSILRARRVNKIRTTFVQSIRDHLVGERIHCVFNQLRSSKDDDDETKDEGQGARYGRCSSKNPNMQQQPARDPEIGPFWREIYIPEDGELWCSADFSSQEPRQAVHYACDPALKMGNIKVDGKWVDAKASALLVSQQYHDNPRTDPHQTLANIIMGRVATKEERFEAKTIFLGLSYGMGGPKLCRSLGFSTIMAVKDPETWELYEASTPEAKRLIAQGARIFEAAGAQGQALLNKFDASVPFVRALNKVCQKAATRYGYIRTQAGRKCRFPKDETGNIEWTHKAMNRLIQGSAADQTKETMLAIDAAGIPIMLQVHDELCFSIKRKEDANMIVEIMQNAYKLRVPTIVDCEIGNSWGDAK